MARKPNFDFERREREKAKAAKVAERVKAKAAKAASGKGEDAAGLPADATRDEPQGTA